MMRRLGWRSMLMGVAVMGGFTLPKQSTPGDAASVAVPDSSAPQLLPKKQLRQPVALALAGNRLFVANRRSGSISIIDVAKRQVTGEVPVGGRLSDLAVTPD